MTQKPNWDGWAQQIDGTTALAGVIAWPVEHSLSPPMHNAAFAAGARNWLYVPLPVHPERVEEAVEGIRALGFVGANVTIPHKSTVVDHLDDLSEDARALQAVNTIHVSDGRLVGHNTDGQGFIRSLTEIGWSAQDRDVTVIGAGGAAAAVALALAREEPNRLAVLNRTPEKADDVANSVRAEVPDLLVVTGNLTGGFSQDIISESEIFVDCTSVGMYPDVDVDPVVPVELLDETMLLCDLTYNPRRTVLLKAAEQIGAPMLDGTGMLVHQGAIAYEIWTGTEAPVEVMREALLEALETRADVK